MKFRKNKLTKNVKLTNFGCRLLIVVLAKLLVSPSVQFNNNTNNIVSFQRTNGMKNFAYFKIKCGAYFYGFTSLTAQRNDC